MKTATLPDFTFDEAEHCYRLGGAVIPSVTQVIGSILPGWQADEWYLTRGAALHKAAEYMDQGILDLSSVADEIRGRLLAWEKFRIDFGGTVTNSELRLVHPGYRFAGTLDRTIESDPHLIVADLKSSISPNVEVQLGAYKILWDASGLDSKKITKGVAVALSDDGTYRTHWFDRKQLEMAGRVFLAALTIYGFKQRKGIK